MSRPWLNHGRRPALVTAALITSACAERLADAGGSPSPERVADGVGRAESVAVAERHGGWPPPRLTTAPPAEAARLDSLEQVALTDPSAHARRAAMERIALAGLPGVEPGPYYGIVARLAGIYRRADEYDLRHAIIRAMAGQAEQAAAVRFLMDVAQGGPGPKPPAPPPGAAARANDPPGPLPYEAVRALSRMRHPLGRAALEQLHAAGTVRQPAAREYLELLASRGFREF